MTKKTGWITTAIVAPIVVGVIVDRLKIIDFSTVFTNSYSWFKSFLTGDFGFSLPVWGWILVIVAISGTYYFTRSIYKKVKGNDPYESYKSDNILGINWSWDYYLQEVMENSILPLCPKCAFELQPYRASAFNAVNHVGFRCHKCGWQHEFQATHNDVIHTVIKSIEHNIRTEYKKAS